MHALLELEVKQKVDSTSENDFGHFRDVWRRTFDRALAGKRALKSGRPRSVTKRDLSSGLTNLLEKQKDVRHHHMPVFPWPDTIDGLAGAEVFI